MLGELRGLIVNEACASIPVPDEPILDWGALMRPFDKAQTPIPYCRILQRVPESHRARRICVQERAILVRWNTTADLGLFADDHALEDAWVAEAEGARYRGIGGG